MSGGAATLVVSLSILHWRCRKDAGKTTVRRQHKAFNTPLEMLHHANACLSHASSIVAFNTPLEMQEKWPGWERFVDRATFNTPLEMLKRRFNGIPVVVEERFQYSIGDARQVFYTSPAARSIPFNTPLEMPTVMNMATRSTESILSILHWRCSYVRRGRRSFST